MKNFIEWLKEKKEISRPLLAVMCYLLGLAAGLAVALII